MKNLIILGSTGSIGVNALKIVEANRDRFNVVALGAKASVKILAQQIEIFCPKLVSVADRATATELRKLCRRRVKVVTGVKGAIECATDPDGDLVLSAMVGAVGLEPTMAAIIAGKDIALANKETLVVAGELVMKEARRKRVKIIPVDSEHSAIFQAMRGEKKKSVRRLIVTASGGPFLRSSKKDLKKVTVKSALNHPNWSMGPKISIDSATMMNKGLEVIEARWLFNLKPELIDVLVHPQSIIHSMVEFTDTSVIAQLGAPDMRGPISFALNYPDRLEKLDAPRLDLAKIGLLNFEEPDLKKFPALRMAYESLARGGSAPATLNAANEVAVESFLNGRIAFTSIPVVVEKTVQRVDGGSVTTIEDALSIDRTAREIAREVVAGPVARPQRLTLTL